MPAKSSTQQDVLINSAEVRAWLEMSHDQFDALLASGRLKAAPAPPGLPTVFSAAHVAKLAKERRRAAG
jgi:hypothetical protein